MRVNHAMILNVINQPADPVATLRALMEDNHEDERGRVRLAEQARSLSEELLASGVLEALPEPDEHGRTLRLAPALQADFALNQPLASFAQAAFDLIDPEAETFALDVLSVVESILDDPAPVLMAQQFKERGEAVAEMKADGIEYEERMELLEEVTHPRPLAEPLEQALRLYRETHPWVLETDLSPKSVVRDMYETGRTFTEFIAFYGVAPLGGARPALPERRLPGAAPDRARADPHGRARRHHRVARRDRPPDRLEPARRVGGADRPGAFARAAAAHAAGEPLPPPRPITANERAFRVMVRNAMFQKVQLAARDRFAALGELETAAAALAEPPARVTMNAAAWEERLGAYWDEHETMGSGPAARAPELLLIDRSPAGADGRDLARAPDHRRPRRATTTGRSWPPSTSTPPTPRASRWSGRGRSGRRADLSRRVAAARSQPVDPRRRAGRLCGAPADRRRARGRRLRRGRARRYVTRVLPMGCSGSTKDRLDRALAEEADGLQRLRAGVGDAVGRERRDDDEVAGPHVPALVPGMGLALARDDVEDLLGAVGVGGQVLARLAPRSTRRRCARRRWRG